MFFLPLEDTPQEFLASEIVPGFFLRFSKMLFYGGLRPDAGVIRPWEPENFKALIRARRARMS